MAKLHSALGKLIFIVPLVVLVIMKVFEEQLELHGYVLLVSVWLALYVLRAVVDLVIIGLLLKKGQRHSGQVVYSYSNHRRLRDQIQVSADGREVDVLNHYPLMNQPRQGKKVTVLLDSQGKCALIVGKKASYYAAPVIELSFVVLAVLCVLYVL